MNVLVSSCMVCMDACTVNLHLLSQHLLPHLHEAVDAARLSDGDTVPLVLQAAVLEGMLKLLIGEVDARGRHQVPAQQAARFLRVRNNLGSAAHRQQQPAGEAESEQQRENGGKEKD